MFVDDECPSDNLASLNQTISNVIDKYKRIDNVSTASVYLKIYGGSDWTAVNDEEKYEPGSLFKVPILIASLKMDEKNPGFLNQKLLYARPFDIGKKVNFKNKSIVLGNTYSIRELLKYMISYSDNNATALIETVLDGKTLIKLFTDLGLEVPNMASSQYLFTARGYSYFMRSICNASYLNTTNSEYAAELLSKSEFKDGISKGLPSTVKIIHKFGESGNQTEKQLHECAIIYLDNKTYLLTVMTKGKDVGKLSKLIQEISQTVYNEMINQSQS